MSIHETIAEVDMRPSARGLDWGADGFEEFVQATSDRMYRSALVLTAGDHQLAEDLTQATYTRVYVAWARISLSPTTTITREQLAEVLSQPAWANLVPAGQ